jgi:serine/threonine protein kinase
MADNRVEKTVDLASDADDLKSDTPPQELLISQRYELMTEIGRGGMGVVYRARLRKSNRRIARLPHRAKSIA